MATIITSNRAATRYLANFYTGIAPEDPVIRADFGRERYLVAGAAVAMSDIVAFGRASGAEMTGADGLRRMVVADRARVVSRDPVTGAQGLLVEPVRSNAIRGTDAVVAQTYAKTTTAASPVWVLSMEGSGSVSLSGDVADVAFGAASIAGMTATAMTPIVAYDAGANGTVGQIVITPSGTVTFAQLERTNQLISGPTSRIHNNQPSGVVTRQAEVVGLAAARLAAIAGDFTLLVRVSETSDGISRAGTPAGSALYRSVMEVVFGANTDLTIMSARDLTGLRYVRCRARLGGVEAVRNIMVPIGRSYTVAVSKSNAGIKFGAGGAVVSVADTWTGLAATGLSLGGIPRWGTYPMAGIYQGMQVYGRSLTTDEMAAATR